MAHKAIRRQKPAGQANPRKSGRPTEIEARISLRAYHLYTERGCEPGHALEDWLRAEVEVMRQRIDTLAM